MTQVFNHPALAGLILTVEPDTSGKSRNISKVNLSADGSKRLSIWTKTEEELSVVVASFKSANSFQELIINLTAHRGA